MVSNSSQGKTLLLFGSQISSLDKRLFQSLRDSIGKSSSLDWILDVVKALPVNWLQASQRVPKLQKGHGIVQLGQLYTWLTTDSPPTDAFPLSNLVLTPLVVVTHLVQYVQYNETHHPKLDPSSLEVLGFCTGLLASFAVTSTSTLDDGFKERAAVAIRLAMIAGAVADAQEHAVEGYGESKILTVTWRSPDSRPRFIEILEGFSEAYVSVWYDTNRATVTVSARVATQLITSLHEAGLLTTTINLRGRFHFSLNEEILAQVLDFCDRMPEYQLADTTSRGVVAHSNSGDTLVRGPRDSLHHIALHSILVDTADWYTSFDRVIQSSSFANIVVFGPERCLPPSTLVAIGPKVVYLSHEAAPSPGAEPPSKGSEMERPITRELRCSDIAVVGMSIKAAGVDDVDGYWKLLLRAQSQHRSVPGERFSFETPFRQASRKQHFGNFIDDHDTFDHAFFKKSPRETEWADPQQRWMLQVAYRSLEHAGYFSSPRYSSKNRPGIGCFVGVCARDYEDNVASHEAGTFGATGTLQAFIAGKVSHYFGWTGPSMTIDTACSSSGVAMHLACNAIRNGDCEAALVGGSLIFTSPAYFENLGAASFLSPTGQCKPFDARADGYCRGEGIAAVFLKPAPLAITDGDQILGVIAATAVQQNDSSTPVFVPNKPSLSSLFRNVLRKADIGPTQISVVEAHGTGTAVGDPVEYDSLHSVFTQGRAEPLVVSSVKGMIGHTECTSGLVSLIKALLMMSYNYIPAQAGFTSLHPAIRASPMLEIPTAGRLWSNKFKAVLINNYGASGSNTAMVVTQGPARIEGKGFMIPGDKDQRYPFRLYGFNDRSIRASCARLLHLVDTMDSSEQERPSFLADFSFNLCRQSNPSLPRAFIFSCATLSELKVKLRGFKDQEAEKFACTEIPPSRPVILCFGGQVSTFVGLDQTLVEQCKGLRKHLDACDAVCTSLGKSSIYPTIFQTQPISDPALLQPALFALQYACARTWMDCGVRPAAIVGHSFGELTGLCVSGVLSLQDVLKLLIGRAELLRDAWSHDRGAMVAVRATGQQVDDLLLAARQACPDEHVPEVACFNGPTSFTVAGPTKMMEIFCKLATAEGVKVLRLDVTHAFHSVLAEPLMADLERLAQECFFREATIPIETATEAPISAQLAPNHITRHFRTPVYFGPAVQRLAEKFPSAIWLEAGSKSTITNMARRVIPSARSHHYQSINITSEQGLSQLADSMAELWSAGLNAEFWAHYQAEYTPMFLPAYPFEKSRHWLPLQSPPGTDESVSAERMDEAMVSFHSWQDDKRRNARFRIHTDNREYVKYMDGHHVVHTAPICPATLQLQLVVEAVRSLRVKTHCDDGLAELRPSFQDIEYQVPICHDRSRSLWLDVMTDSWQWQLFSMADETCQAPKPTVHARGGLSFQQTGRELAVYERLISHPTATDLIKDQDAEIVRGRAIYRLFSQIVDYSDVYRLLSMVVSRGDKSAARILIPEQAARSDAWLNMLVADSFCQAAGFVVNCMDDGAKNQAYLATGIERWIRSARVRHAAKSPAPGTFDVFVMHHHATEQTRICDVFVFDPRDGSLVEVILGLKFQRTMTVSLKRLLSRLTPATANYASGLEIPSPMASTGPANPANLPAREYTSTEAPVHPSLLDEVKKLLATISGVDSSKIREESQLDLAGVDSLMTTEFAREIKIAFGSTIGSQHLTPLSTVGEVVQLIRSHFDQTSIMTATRPSTPQSVDRDGILGPMEAIRPRAQINSASDTNGVDFIAYLAGFLGVLTDEIHLAPERPLAEMGLDSLLSTELQLDINRLFGVSLAGGPALGRLTAHQLRAAVTSTSAVLSPPNPVGGLRVAAKPATISLQMASASSTLSTPILTQSIAHREADTLVRAAAVNGYVTKYSAKFYLPPLSVSTDAADANKQTLCVVITGTTGSLGSFLAAHWAEQSGVSAVYCLNRRHFFASRTPYEQQAHMVRTLSDHGITLSITALSKLKVYETDTTLPCLGLPETEYKVVVRSVTHIVHNAWPMSLLRSIGWFEPQFCSMQELINLAASASAYRKVSFQFISSIAVVARHTPDRTTGTALVPEAHVGLEAAMRCGYADAKYVCESMLDATLRRHPGRVSASVVRLGQVSGSSTSGYWNANEHMPALVKSSQALGSLPALEGTLSWLPVDIAAKVLSELALVSEPMGVYHVENPARQDWGDMINMLRKSLRLSEAMVVPMDHWLEKVKKFGDQGEENPAANLVDFFESDFVRNACGELALDTTLAVGASHTMVTAGPVTEELVTKYVDSWVSNGFLCNNT